MCIRDSIFHFAHRTFQEYLAACEIVRCCHEADSFALLRNLIQSKPQVWREPGLLVADVLVENAHSSDLWQLVGDLLGDDLPTNVSANDAHWWSLWLAAAIADEQGLAAAVPTRRAERTTREFLRDYIVLLVECPKALLPVERTFCGRILGIIGDPRPGVGLRADGLPDIVWCEVPVGDFIMGSEISDTEKPVQVINLATFYMAKYPVTLAQFQKFVESPDGYTNIRWWDGLNDEGLIQQKNGIARQYLSIGNYPRVDVSWYESMAFCRWLSANLGYEITLPTEEQWEKAARSLDGREYPWGNGYRMGYANIDESNLDGGGCLQGQTAVGLYPQGASLYGIQDLAGNIGEWTLTEYSNKLSGNVNNKRNRVIRGGSWFDFSDDVRSSCRIPYKAIDRFDSYGFRICCRTYPMDKS